MEQQVAPLSSESQLQHPKAILSRIHEKTQVDHPDISALLKDIELLDQTGLTKLPKTSAFLKSIGTNAGIRIALIEQVRQDDLNQDRQAVQKDLRLAQILGLEQSPQTLKLIRFLRRKYTLKEPSRKRLPTKLALATAAALTGAASLGVAPTISHLLTQAQERKATLSAQSSQIGIEFQPDQKDAEQLVQETPQVILKEKLPIKLSESKTGVDSNSPVHWDRDTVYVFTSTRDKVWRSSGPDLNHLSKKEPVTFDNKVNGGRWIEATYKDPNSDILYGWYHNEPMGLDKQFPQLKREQPLIAPRIGAATSKDNGLTWHDLGFVLDTPEPSMDSLDMESINLYFSGGNGDFSVIPDQNKEYFYFFFTNYHKDKNQQGVTIARMKYEDRNNPQGKVWKWHDGKWQERGEGGKVSLIFPAKGNVHKAEADFFWGPALSYNTHLKTYVMFLNHSQDAAYTQEGVYVSFNPDITNPSGWSKPVKIYTPQTSTNWYPQIIGKRTGETDKLVGKTARLFVTGESATEITFLKPGEQPPKLKGNGGFLAK